MTSGVGFASLAALVAHVALFHGRYIIMTCTFDVESTLYYHRYMGAKQIKFSRENNGYTHQTHEEQPWACPYLPANITKTSFNCRGGVFYLHVASPFSSPFQLESSLLLQISLNIITEYVIGYMYPGYPVANVLFKTYG
ncbi:oligopeptide transporter 7 [Quercus suber]|uniref:Oligopeptide transporter 7 n=1 Tax=Quercus suber TaxID=58331 RepID=A0AAW0JGP2_QUESU